MAKRKFVSSKKNAPSRAISSKEAALHRRSAGVDGASSDSGDSAVSSDVASSTLLSSEDEQGDDDEDLSVNQDVTVEVMPASVGRGKQLRFPAAFSRGKVLPAEGGAVSDVDDSDDESLLSVADSETEDDNRSASAKETVEISVPMTPSVHAEALAASRDCKSRYKEITSYPIKAIRARKRHRPDSEYYKHMSTYVRDCLLHVRQTGNSEIPANGLQDESSLRHEEFRRRLATGDVERMTWKEPPSVEPKRNDSNTELFTNPSCEPKKISKSSKLSKCSKPSKQRESSNLSKSSNKDSSTIKTSTADFYERNTKQSTPLRSNGSSIKITSTLQSTVPVVSNSSAICEVCKKRLSEEAVKADIVERPVKTEKVIKTEKVVKDENVRQHSEPIEKESIQAFASVMPAGYFTITFSPGSDVQKLRSESAKLMDEARRLKHEGNRLGSSERGTAGQLTQAKYYLRSGGKFFEYALKLQEVKVAYQEKNDAQHAHSFGENCVTTLSQTTSLIESTIRTFQSAGSMRLAALGCKMASVVHLTVYRLQHRKLQSFYSELFTPGRSPESRENGLTPPIDSNSNANSNSSKDAAIRKHLLREMEHTLRGFEMWRRYEACKVSVLPQVANPMILDLAVFFEDLKAELNHL